VRWLALAGVIGPIWFTLVVIAQGVLQPDYSHVAMPISALAAWPHGWLQRLNFYVFGLLLTANAVGLHLAMRPSRRGALAFPLLLTSGIGVVLAGVFSWTGDPSTQLVEPVAHVIAALMTFLGAGSGLVALSRRMAGDPAWRGLSTYTRACGMTILVLFPVLGFLAMPPGAPLHAVAGLLQRLVLLAWFPCIIALSVRLMRAPACSAAARRSPRP
jgi:hypothetical membrane protein